MCKRGDPAEYIAIISDGECRLVNSYYEEIPGVNAFVCNAQCMKLQLPSLRFRFPFQESDDAGVFTAEMHTLRRPKTRRRPHKSHEVISFGPGSCFGYAAFDSTGGALAQHFAGAPSPL